MKKIYIIGAIAIIICVYTFTNIKREKEYENIYIEENTIIEETKEEIGKIKIHIAGEILNPGIYEIEENARVDDAIKLAGGTTESADLDKINLAYEIFDGEKIYIPSIFDEEMEYNVSSGNVQGNGKININKADIQELQKISGIGESLANRIISYREENGKFSSVEDIKNVSGIGEKKFENIKDQIVVK